MLYSYGVMQPLTRHEQYVVQQDKFVARKNCFNLSRDII